VKTRKALVRVTTVLLLLLVAAMAMIFILAVGLFVAWFTLPPR
jgi:hypothetical protein